jgi:hypothetical protein
VAGRSVYQLESRHCFALVAAFCCLETGRVRELNKTFKPIANRSNRSGLFAPGIYRKPLWLVRFGLEGRPTAAITLSRKTRFLVLSQRLKRHDHNPQWRVGNFGENCDAYAIRYSRCSQNPCALELGGRDERGSIRPIAGCRESGHRARSLWFGPAQ